MPTTASHDYSLNKSTDPSDSVIEVNIPKVLNERGQFVYNYYTADERVTPSVSTSAKGTSLSSDKIARYSLLSWTPPVVTNDTSTLVGNLTIESNASKIISQDDYFNSGFINHTFSNIDAIQQGSSDLENFSRLSRNDAESMFKMSKSLIQNLAEQHTVQNSDPSIENTFSPLKSLTESYLKLSDFPKTSIGLKVFDMNGNQVDDDETIRNISNSVSLSLKINAAIIPDIFKDSTLKSPSKSLNSLNVAYANSVSGYKTLATNSENRMILPVSTRPVDSNTYKDRTVKAIGYVIDRYQVDGENFVKDATFYIEDVKINTFKDTTVLYGKVYVYSIKVVASTEILSYTINGEVHASTLYVASRPTSLPIECFEYSPPPPPQDLRFSFDYFKRNLCINWDLPINPQLDIKQFQVFRRKSIKDPFELIAQYGFDNSLTGPEGKKYRTGERVDANNLSDMSNEDKYLVHIPSPQDDPNFPHNFHIDEEFTVDTEFFESSTYIYSVCSIDAHGMISNYSTQHEVTFDPYKNRVVSRVVCDSGSPRQYPNMKLRVDTFKDVIAVSGEESRQFSIYFTPEYLKVKDDRRTYKIVEAKTPNKNSSYYLLQLVNLDNQKMQLLKINILDSIGLTLK